MRDLLPPFFFNAYFTIKCLYVTSYVYTIDARMLRRGFRRINILWLFTYALFYLTPCICNLLRIYY